ncbi:potassium channel SKOR-like isoform X1 [Olea europaea var. sylvestris]|uniref:potassium channel SKOR-like isoform X1 n=1 Tax=Olea europaea var. sylvestris TaxID=158386 RepID=UPI000C1D190C|nr:potassium channel SKOR-like isoform X1 [Olea europaea var. sylvestris]
MSEIYSSRGRSKRDDESEDEDTQETSRLSWNYWFKVLRNYSRQDYGTGGRSHSRAYIIDPDNWWYLAWTQFILIWAVYSSFFTPLEFAFFRGLPDKFFLLDIAGQFAFLIDIVVQFFVDYRDPHFFRLVSNHNLIAIRYLKSRFLVDLLGCLPWDAIYKVCGKKEAVRYMLWIRLSRVFRVAEFFEKLEKNIRINYLFTRIVKLFVVELYCTHTAACIFYYLATTLPSSKEGYTWIGSLQLGDYSYTNFREIDLWTRYVTSLYFAIVTMATVGYGDIHAVNVREMIFVMIYVSFDMILGAYLLGNMTALIVKGSKTERFRDKMAELIKYMNTKKLGQNISKEVERHVRLQYERNYTNASVLEDLPLATRAKISRKLYQQHIKEIPLFKGCSDGFVKQIAIRVHEEFFLPGEVIIEDGKTVDQLYFLCDGKLEEVKKYEDPETQGSLSTLDTHSSVGEISVLCNIPECRTVQATELSRLLRIDKQAFIDILEIHFRDGRTVINNLLEGKESTFRSDIMESDVIPHIEKNESEYAMRLNCAAHNGDLHRLRHFVEAGADPNKADYNGRTALHLAASNGYEDIVQFLIQGKVEINIRDNFGKTPLYEAIKNSHDRVASLLVNAGASLSIDNAGNCLCEAVASRDLDFLKRLLANGINPNSKNYDLRTPLHLAASEGLYPESILLLESGASVFATDRWGKTPLDEARIGGNKGLIMLLEDARISQLSEFSVCLERIEGKTQKKKCTVFPGKPWDCRDDRSIGVVLWVPQTIEELIETAKEQLNFTSGSFILSGNGGKILDTSMISDTEKLYLVGEAQ